MKSGLEYFPLDVSLDSKMELIEAEFGMTGFGVVVKLLQEIYGKQGYYIEWTEEVALLFSRKIGEGVGVVSEIVAVSIKRGMFDQNIFDKYRVLTSRGIQKRYFEAVSRRKEVEVDNNILLVDPAQFCKNVNITYKNVNIISKNVDISKQSKVEKSKVEESRVDSRLTGGTKRSTKFIKPTLEEIQQYCSERGNNIDPQYFLDSNEARGWVVGKNQTPMKDWRAAIRTWEKFEFNKSTVHKDESNIDDADSEEEIRRMQKLRDIIAGESTDRAEVSTENDS